MADHPDSAVIRNYFAAVHQDPRLTVELYHPDVTLHYSGRHRLSGDYHGTDAVLELFRQSREAFHGTQRLDLHDVVAGDRHAVALLAATAELRDSSVRWNRVVVFHVEDGRIAEQWIIDGDQALVDEVVGR